MATLSSVFDRFLRYHMLAQSFRGRPVVEDHQALYDFALRRDAQQAKAVIRRHVHSGVEHILKCGIVA